MGGFSKVPHIKRYYLYAAFIRRGDILNFTCKGISKKFGAVVALQDVALSIEKGEVRALLGGNGSGKSTLAKVIAGVVKNDTGEMTAFGQPYAIHSPLDAKKKGIVMTAQELSLIANLTVAQNLLLCHIPSKGKILTDQKKIIREAKKVLDELSIGHLLNKRIDDLAPNEKYLIEYAKAVVQKPRVLIIDEITSTLYKEDVEIVKKSIEALKQDGCSIIFISHRMPEVFEICDSVTIMRSGSVVAEISIDNAQEHELLSHMTGRTISKEDMENETVPDDYSREGKVVLSIKDMKLKGFEESSVSIDIHEGEVIGVAGLQGHGQSTLVRQIFGVNHHVEMQIDGEDVVIQSPRQAIKHGMAFIPGDREGEGVFREQSISENLHTVDNLILKKKNYNRDAAILSEYNVVYGGLRNKLTTLSGGNQQKVVIGRWTLAEPKILLADDPTKGIDVQARTDVHKIFNDLASKGSIVIMVSSDDAELVNLAKHSHKAAVIVMYEGHIIKTLRGAEITEENIGQASLQVKRGTEQ